MAHRIINEGYVSSKDDELWMFADEIEGEIYPILENAEKILHTLRTLTDLLLESEEEEEEENEEDNF